MDIATVAGLALSVGAIILSALIEGSPLGALLQPGAMVLILGGTIGATMTSFGLKDIMKLPKLILKTIIPPRREPGELVKEMVNLAELARREGLLSLEQRVGQIQDPFARKGVRLVIDGANPELIQSMLETEIVLRSQAAKHEIAMFEAAGGFAPTMGIIGTVIGLVHVLGNLSEPDKLGEAIAAAFIATLWGILTANVFWLPLANKLKLLAREESMLAQLTAEGILSIQRGDNPRIVEEKLLIFLHQEGKAESTSGEAA